MKIILRTDLKGITIDSAPLEVFDFTDEIITLHWKRNELPLEGQLNDNIATLEVSDGKIVGEVKKAGFVYKKTDETVKLKDGFARVYELFTID